MLGPLLLAAIPSLIAAGASLASSGISAIQDRNRRRRERRSARKQAQAMQGNMQTRGSSSPVTSSSVPGPEGNDITGYNPQLLQFSPYTPAQQESQNRLLPHVTNELFNQTGSFDPYAAKARRGF